MKYAKAIIQGCIGVRTALRNERYEDAQRFLELIGAIVEDNQARDLLGYARAIANDLHLEKYCTPEDAEAAVWALNNAIDQIQEHAQDCVRVTQEIRSRSGKLASDRHVWLRTADKDERRKRAADKNKPRKATQ